MDTVQKGMASIAIKNHKIIAQKNLTLLATSASLTGNGKSSQKKKKTKVVVDFAVKSYTSQKKGFQIS